MKSRGFIILILIAALLFIPGAYLPKSAGTIKYLLMITGTVIGFTFYLLTFIHAMTGHHLSKTRITIFRIIIVCLPVIGNLIYVIFYNAQSKPQEIPDASSPD